MPNAEERLREVQYLVSLESDPSFNAMMEASDDLEAGTPANELLQKLG